MLLLSSNRSIALQSSTYAGPAVVDLHAVCGPRYNALLPAAAGDGERPEFFRPCDGPRPYGEADVERWDGLA